MMLVNCVPIKTLFILPPPRSHTKSLPCRLLLPRQLPLHLLHRQKPPNPLLQRQLPLLLPSRSKEKKSLPHLLPFVAKNGSVFFAALMTIGQTCVPRKQHMLLANLAAAAQEVVVVVVVVVVRELFVL